MTWCERCVADHDGPCIDEFARREILRALEAYRRACQQRAPRRNRSANTTRRRDGHSPAGPYGPGIRPRSSHRLSDADWLERHYDLMNRFR